METVIEIPAIGPTTNHAYIQRGYRRIKTRAYLEWEGLVELHMQSIMPPVGFLAVEIDFHTKWFTSKGKPRRRDLDNLIKHTLDPVFHFFELDDCFVFEIKARKINAKEDKTVIRIFAKDEH